MATPGEDKQAFMDRIRSVLQRDPSTAVETPPAVDESIIRLASREDDLFDLAMRNIEAVSMKPQRVTLATLPETLHTLLDTIQPKTAAVSEAALGRLFDVAGVLDARGIERIASSDGNFRAQFAADVGLTDVRAVLAETGTLVVATDASHSRGPSLVPPIHIAIARASDIVPDMLDVYAGLKGLPPRELPSSIAYITGPSKTADIEGMLVQGIHGPQTVHVLLVEDA